VTVAVALGPRESGIVVVAECGALAVKASERGIGSPLRIDRRTSGSSWVVVGGATDSSRYSSASMFEHFRQLGAFRIVVLPPTADFGLGAGFPGWTTCFAHAAMAMAATAAASTSLLVFAFFRVMPYIIH
jgi:hypothetical protein